MKKIIYVEDNEDTRIAVEMLLKKANFDITTVCCGKDCLNKAKKEKFDLFLLDIMLPDMSGWDIYESLKNSQKNAKYAFLSAIPVSQDRLNELKKAGVSDYITKPFTKDDLIKRIEKILKS